MRELNRMGITISDDAPILSIGRIVSRLIGQKVPPKTPAQASAVLSQWVTRFQLSRAADPVHAWKPLQGYSLRVTDSRSTRHIPSVVGDVRVWADGRRESVFLLKKEEAGQRAALQVHTAGKPGLLGNARGAGVEHA